MLDFVGALPDAREGVRRLSQVLSGIVMSTRMSEVRRGTTQSYTGSGSFSAPMGSRMLSSEDAQLAQESVDRLAALIALGPSSRTATQTHVGSDGSVTRAPSASAAASGAAEVPAPGLEGLPEDQAEQYLNEMYDMLLLCRVPEAIGELTAMASSTLLGPNPRGGTVPYGGPGGGGGGGAEHWDRGGVSTYDEAAIHEEAVRRRSMDLRLSLDMYVRDGGPSPARASIEGLLCNQKLGGHAQALLESISQMLLSCVFDPIWRHRDLLAQPRVRELVVALSSSSLIPAMSNICLKLRLLMCRHATYEAASHAWLLGFVSKIFTGLSRCMKAMVEFEACAALWAQLGDAFALQLSSTRLVERFSDAASSVHSSYLTWRLPPPAGVPIDMGPPMAAGAAAGGGPSARPGEIYLELCSAVEVFLEGLFHLTWHFTARAEEAAAAGPPPPLLVRDVLAAMEPEGSGSVADLLAAAAAAATAFDVRAGVLGPLTALLGSGASSMSSVWPALVSGRATHSLAADWLAHVVSRLDGGEVLSGTLGLAPEVAAAAPLLHKPGPVDKDELPLLLSVCLAVAAAGGSAFIANGGSAASRYSDTPSRMGGGRSGRKSIEILFNAVTGGGGGGGGDNQGSAADAELMSSSAVKHASRLLQLVARGLKAMAATQDAELAPYPAIHAAHACAVAMHDILKDHAAAQARANRGLEWNSSSLDPPSGGGGGGGSKQAFWPLAAPPPKHTALLLDSFMASLLCYSAFLQPDPDKDPLTLRAVERCHEQLLELCTAIGEDLRLGVAAVAYAAQSGLLPALEAVLRAAALTCRLETLRVLLTAVLTSVPALQQLLLSRDGYIFLTLRKLIIACINLACPHPLEYPMPAVQPPISRRSLTLILQQCSSTAHSSAPNSSQHSVPPFTRGMLVPDWAVHGNTSYSHQAAAASTAATPGGGGSGAVVAPGRASVDSTSGHSNVVHPSGRPLILPLAVDLLDTVSMLARRFIEVHEGRVAAAAHIRMDAAGNVLESVDGSGSSDSGNEGSGFEEVVDGADGGGEGDDMDRKRLRSGSMASRTSSLSAATTRRRRSFEREATELLPLSQLLPFALWWLGGPLSDLVDALAQEVINDDGSGSLFGDFPTGGGGSSGGGGGGGGAGQRSHHPRAFPRAVSPASSSPQPQVDSRRGSIELQPTVSYSKADMRRRQSMEASRASPLSAKPVARGSIVDSLGGGDGSDLLSAGAPPLPTLRQNAWSSALSPGGISTTYASERSWLVLSRCADTLHSLFRLMVTLSDLNRRAPHPDWSTLIASLQPQQLLARAVQVLVRGVQVQRQQAAADTSGRASRPRSPAFPVLLSSLLSASVCGVQYGWLVPESFGIPSANLDPAELEQLPHPASASAAGAVHYPAAVQPPHAPAPPPPTAGGGGGSSGPVQGPLFSRVRRFTVISANPEGRAYQWAMIGDEEEAVVEVGVEQPDGRDGSDSVHSRDGEVEGVAEGEENGEMGTSCSQRRRPVLQLPAAAPGGSWSCLPPPPGPAVVPTRALQVLVSEYGSAADKVLFDLLLRGLSGPAAAAAGAAAATVAGGGGGGASSGTAATSVAGDGSDQFFWVPPSRCSWLRTCSNPCCMNLSGLHEAQLQLAACPLCGMEWYCSRHCQAMHWHTGHKTKCRVK